MRISVITPTYNGERFLPQTIESVLAQTLQPIEFIIVDDSSTDQTTAVIQDFSRRAPFIRLIEQENCGNPNGGRNNGFAQIHPNSECVLFLDQDDVLEPDALELLAAELIKYPNSPAAVGLARYVDGEGRVIRVGEAEATLLERKVVSGATLRQARADEMVSYSHLLVHDPILTPGQALIRRGALEAIGGFKPHITGAADWDVWLRLSLSGDIRLLNHTVLNYRRHTTNLSHNLNKLIQAEQQMRLPLLAEGSLTHEQMQQMMTGWRLKDREMIANRWQWCWNGLTRMQWREFARQAWHGTRSAGEFVSNWQFPGHRRQLARK
jgi:glycosyltransferase involved in cell wall biosynthesis